MTIREKAIEAFAAAEKHYRELVEKHEVMTAQYNELRKEVASAALNLEAAKRTVKLIDAIGGE